MKTILLKNLFYFVFATMVLYLMSDYRYFIEIQKLDQIKQKNVIVVYDEFSRNNGESAHGELVSKILIQSLDASDYKLLKYDMQDINIRSIKKILIYLAAKKGLEVWFNSSNSPDNSVGGALKVRAYQELSKYNIHMFQAGGNNNIEIISYIKKFTHKARRAEEINNKVYSLLNTKLDQIKEVGRNEGVEQFFVFGDIWGLMLADVYKKIFYDREVGMKDIIVPVIDEVLGGYDLKINKDELVKLYVENMKQFLFIVELQTTKTNVVVVGSDSKLYFKDDNITAHSLNCPVSGLVDYDVQENGGWVDEGKQFVGTSISSPLHLSAIFNKSLTNGLK